MVSYQIYEFYSELVGFKPKIWRCFQVAGDITIARLGYIVQVLYEMEASHLIAIEVPKGKNVRAILQNENPDKRYPRDYDSIIWRFIFSFDEYEPSDPNIKTMDATKIKMNKVITEPGEMLSVNYDYGDDWLVSLKLERVFTEDKLTKSELPRVLAGEGFGIVEDCGGVYGLARLVKAFQKKKGKEYTELSEWLGVKDFEIIAFDITDMNFRLKKIPRIYKQSYEDRLMPTKKSIDLIERKYLQKPNKV